MPDDLKFVTEASPQVQDYLLSNELYWPLGGNLPRLTVGSLLLALARLRGVNPLQAQKHLVVVEAARMRWPALWERKAAREIENRLRLWNAFLAEYHSSPESHADAYPYEVRQRVILHFLVEETPRAPAPASLAEADALLRRSLRPAPFVWEPALEAVFPTEPFWFLYGKLP